MNDRALDLLNEAKNLLVSGEKKQKGADADKWAAAEKMYLANVEENASIRDIAGVVGLSKTTVARHVALWAKHGLSQASQAVDSLSFTEAFYDVIGEDAGDREERAARAVLADPERRGAVMDSLGSKERAGIATDLVSQKDVRHEIVNSPALVTDQFVEVVQEVVQDARERGDDRMKKKYPKLASNKVQSDLERIVNHLSAACQLAAEVNYEAVKYGVKADTDLFARMTTTLGKAKAYIEQIEDAINAEGITDTEIPSESI